MMAITTKSSTRVNPLRDLEPPLLDLAFGIMATPHARRN
jgi:hypothetical protein